MTTAYGIGRPEFDDATITEKLPVYLNRLVKKGYGGAGYHAQGQIALLKQAFSPVERLVATV